MKKINIGLLITGNELLSFKTKDTNGPFMGMHLRKIGMPVRSSMMCGDNEEDILDCLDYLSKRCQIIFTTGGLGPTSDDLTAQVVAKFFDVETVYYEEAWQNCLEAYRRFNRYQIPESNKKQAYLPEGSTIIPNKVGTAVGFNVSGKKNGKLVSICSLPGVPFEMEDMFLKEVFPDLVSKSIPAVTKTWQIFSMGESAMQSAINDAEKNLHALFPESSISYQAHAGYVTYSATLSASSHEEQAKCEAYLEKEFTSDVEKAFQGSILYAEDKPPVQYLVESLKKKNLTLSLLEGSCGGLLSKLVSQVKNAEEVFMASIVLQGDKNKKAELSRDLADDSITIKKLGIMKSDVTLSEWGAPSEDLATKEFPHGHFNLTISFNKKKIHNVFNFQKKLENLLWKKEEKIETDERVSYSYSLTVTTRYSKEVQNLRVSTHCICSLILILECL